ncbi:uncharacterized protein RHO25_004725 [Cercospora beticola]|nr:hypothetical protein RHO25_004725 [Cercospora beticola]
MLPPPSSTYEKMEDDEEFRKPSLYSMATSEFSNQSSLTDVSLLQNKATISEEDLKLQYADRIAKKEFLESYMAKYPMPELTGHLPWKKFRHGWFTAYRRLFTFVFVVNLVAILLLAVLRPHTTFDTASIGVASNILASVLVRHDNLANGWIKLTHTFGKWPLFLRRRAVRIYSHGGIHSGCGASATMWFIYFSVLVVIQPLKDDQNLLRVALFITTGVILACLLAIVGMSHPTFRIKHHNVWEMSHRYIGWFVTAMIWVLVVITCAASSKPLSTALLESPPFWCTLIVTILLIYPWAIMRKRSFTATQLSDHALKCDFDYRLPSVGHSIRIASSPMGDYHTFATIPRADGKQGFSVVISNAGDWTKKMIEPGSRQDKLWTRGRVFLGVMEVPMLFKPLVIAATGSGISPCMAFMNTHPNWPIRLVWSTRNPTVTYGKDVMDLVLRADPNAIIIDTKLTGRPNMNALVYAAAKEIQAEAVLLVSTQPVTKSLTFEMEARGVYVISPIFDA